MPERPEIPDWLEREVRERVGPAPERTRWPLVSIVVPTFDRRERLATLVHGLAERTDYPAFEVVVSDNGSTDGTVEWLEREALPFPLRICAHARNLSFSEACNLGAAEARGDLLLFLNNDIDPIEPGWLRRLVTSLEASGAAIAGGVLIDVARASDAGRTGAVQHGGLHFEAAGGTLRTVLRDLGGDLATAIGEDRAVAAVAAACALVRRDAFVAAGRFCELYRYGHEDVDLCLSVAASGGRIVMSRRTVLLHGPDSTRRRLPREEARALQRANARQLLERWGPRLRREHALDAAAGAGVWSTAPDPEAYAGLAYVVRAADPTLGAEVEALARELRDLGHPARTDVDGTGWLLADVVVHLRRGRERDALVGGRCNVLLVRDGDSPPAHEAVRYDLLLDRPTRTNELVARIAGAVERAGGAARVLPHRAPRAVADAPRALLVLGMSRTGTSATTRLLALLGVHLGDEQRLLPPDARINPKGFYEHYEIMRLNTAILRHLGGSWKAPPEFPHGWETDPSLDDLREQAAAILARDFADVPLWGFKDPRTAMTLDFWRPLLGPAPRFVVCHRNPLDVAASLQRRDGLALEQSLALWMRSTAGALVATAGEERIVVGYDEFFDDRDRIVADLAAFAGRPDAATDPSLLARFDEWLEDDLRHHRYTTADLLAHPAAAPEARDLHLALELAIGARTGAAECDPALGVAAERALSAAGREPVSPAAARPARPRPAGPADALAPPLVIGGTGGSGTRAVKRVLDASGLFLGANLNASQDALDMARFDEKWGTHWLAQGASDELLAALEAALDAHLAPMPAGAPGWGWKHPHSYLLLPLLAVRFPGLRFVHVVRDGRDMALSANQRQLERYGPLLLGNGAGEEPDVLRSLAFWASANERAADDGERLLGERYHRVRLEDLCAEPAEVASQLLHFAGASTTGEAVASAAGQVETPSSLGRWRGSVPEPSAAVRRVLQRFGYG